MKAARKKLNKHNKSARIFVGISLLIMILSVCAIGIIPCFAVDEICSVTVNLTDKENNAPIADFEVNICKIAEISGSDYLPSEKFADSGISLENLFDNNNAQHSKEIYRYIKKNKIEYLSSKTDNAGKAAFADLSEGIYIAFCEENQAYTFNPYIIFLPMVINDEKIYDIDSVPKISVNKVNSKNIAVTKVWDDNDNYAGKRPENITIVLNQNGVEYKTAVLNSQNDWKYTFTELPNDGSYSVEEKEVSNYKASYSGDEENGFTITNSYNQNISIPDYLQTGEGGCVLLFAVLIFSAALCVVIIAWRKRKNNIE